MRHSSVFMRSFVASCCVVASLIGSSAAAAAPQSIAAPLAPEQLPDRLRWVEPRASALLQQNISRPDAKPGSVIASPMKREPNYYFHWVRDGAVSMMTLFGLEQRATSPQERERLSKTLLDYVTFTEITQAIAEQAGTYAETRFQVDGTIAHDGWASPQHDGPALRAVSLIQIANKLLKENQFDYVTRHLYSPRIPANTSIKKDLEFIAHHWREPSYDIWEETFGNHFYQYMVQRRALVEGAALAEKMGDPEAAGFYRNVAKQMEGEIDRFYDAGRGYFVASWRQSGIDYKYSNLDIVTVLGVTHGGAKDGYMMATDDRILRTINRLEQAFWGLYPINQGAPVPAVGRYPEDRYDGVLSHAQGNPWFITTFAMAEIYSQIVQETLDRGSFMVNNDNSEFIRFLMGDEGVKLVGQKIEKNNPAFRTFITQALRKADLYMISALSHMNQDTAQMQEQFNRSSGFMQGAVDLTWSYASFFTADWALSDAHQRAADLK